MDAFTVEADSAERTAAPPVGWIGAAIFVVLVGALVYVDVRRNGSFTYPLDDAYIHLRLAENLSSGTLGLNPGEFASAGSSPLWPVLLAAPTGLLGPLVGLPLLLNVIFGIALLVSLDRWARDHELADRERWLLQLGMLVVVPLPVVAFTGMEHVLQVLAFLLLVGVVIDQVVGRVDQRSDPGADDSGIIDEPPPSLRADLFIGLAALFAASLRFETIFLLVPLAVLLLLARRWRAVVIAAVGALIPVAVTALVNLAQGWPALPASVMMKSIANDSTTGLVRLLPHLPSRAILEPRILGVFIAMTVLWWFARQAGTPRWRRMSDCWTFVAVAVLALHFGYLTANGGFRYEAYVMAIAVVATVVNLHTLVSGSELGTRTTVPALFRYGAIACLVLAGVNGLSMYRAVSLAATEIHSQQIQMADFVAEACPGCSIVANDIGALALYSGGHILDDYGLANEWVLRHKLADTWNKERLFDLGEDNDAAMAVVYDDPYWLPGIPDQWERLGTWTIPEATSVGGRTVSFYSLAPERTEELREAFERFEPPDVVDVEVDAP